jgi:hypothetical protein
VIARAIVIVALVAGCEDLVGITDHQPLACDELYVIRDDGRRLEVFPAFRSDVTAYHVVVSSLTIAVQLVMRCADPVASITAAGLPVDASGTTPLIALVEENTDIPILVTAPTEDPPPELLYVLAVTR